MPPSNDRGVHMQTDRQAGKTFTHMMLAPPLALIIYVIAAIVIGGLVGIFNTLTTVMRPGIIGFISVAVGSLAGISAARWACDEWLPLFYPRAVFFMFLSLSVAGVAFEIAFVPFDATKINSYVQLVVSALAAYAFFWQTGRQGLTSEG